MVDETECGLENTQGYLLGLGLLCANCHQNIDDLINDEDEVLGFGRGQVGGLDCFDTDYGFI